MLEYVSPELLPNNYNISQALLEENIKRGFGEKICLYFQEKTLTYNQVLRDVNKAGNLFKNKLGINQETRIALVMYDCPEFIISFLGAVKIGAVAVPLSTTLSPDDYVYLLNDTRAPLLVVDIGLLEVILSIRHRLEYLKDLVIVGDLETRELVSKIKDFRIVIYDESLPAESDYLVAANTNKNDTAFWIYSSGSTGKPKGTIHLHHDIYCAAYYLNQYFYDISENDLIYSASKMFFAFGLGNSFWMPFFSGAASVLERQRSSPEVVSTNIRKYKPTKVYAVPTIFKAIHDYIIDNKQFVEDYQGVQRYYSAGEALTKSLYDKWLELTGREILTILGSTEALQGYCGAWPGMGSPGSLGKMIPGYEAKVVDELGQEVKLNEKGVLMIKGDSIASAYWNRHEESKRTFRGEWLYTGDMVYETEDGILWYAGRSDDVFKIAGLWVSPTEIEEVLSAHPMIQESAVIACDGDKGLGSMVVYIVCKNNIVVDTNLENSLQEFLKSRLPSYKCPRIMRFIKELPRNSSGKLQRFLLRDLNDKIS